MHTTVLRNVPTVPTSEPGPARVVPLARKRISLPPPPGDLRSLLHEGWSGWRERFEGKVRGKGSYLGLAWPPNFEDHKYLS